MSKKLMIYVLLFAFGTQLFAAIKLKAIYPQSFQDRMMVENGIMVVLQEIDPYSATMKVYDSTDPANLDLLSTMDIPYRSGYAPRLRNSMLYIGLPHTGQLHCYSLLDPANPILSYTYAYYMYDLRDMAFSGGYLLVSTQNGGLRVIDISDEENPTEIGSYVDGNQLDRVWAFENIAVVLSYDADAQSAELKVLDISLPAYPNFTGSIALPGYDQYDSIYLSFYRDGSDVYMYMSYSINNYATRIFSFDTVNIPVQMGSLSDGHRATAYHGDQSISVSTMKLTVNDMLDPLQPVQMASFSNIGNWQDHEIAIDYPYAYSLGMVAHCFDISDLSSFDLYTDSVDAGNASSNLRGRDDILYCSDAIIPLNQDGSFSAPLVCQDLAGKAILAINDQLMYAHGLSTPNYGGSLWSMDAPLNPQLLSSFNTTEAKAFLIDNYLLIEENSSANQTLIYDVSIPTAPLLVSSLVGRFSAAILQGNALWLAHHTGLQIYNFQDPVNPEFISTTSWTKPLRYLPQMTYHNGYLYVGGFFEELRIYDMCDHHNPVYAGTAILPFGYDAVNATPVISSDGELLVSTGIANHLVLYSLADPAAPEYISHLELPFSMRIGHYYAHRVYIMHDILLYAMPLPSQTSTLDSIQNPIPVISCGPNPFTGHTTIRVNLSDSKAQYKPELAVYNLRGQMIKSLSLNPQAGSLQEVLWDGRDDQGMLCATGIYLLRLSERGVSLALGKVILIK